MPGTLLLDDLRDSVGQQLGDYAQGLISSAQQAVAPVAAAIPTAPQAPEVDPNAILQELQQHAQQALEASQQAAQPALQVLGGAGQAAGGAVTQLGGAAAQTRDQITQQLQQHAQDVVSGAQDVGQQLQDHVNTVLGSTTPQAPSGVQVLPKPQPPTLGGPAQPAAATGADVLGGPPSADTTASAQPPDRSMSLQDYARAAAVRAGVDPNIFVAQIQQESGFNPQAKSGAGALGIAQFMPATAAGMNVDPTDPYAALDAAAKMDAQNLAKYGGDYSKTLAAYNAGGGAVDQYGGVPPYKETQTYVSTILNNAKQASGGAAPATGSVAPPQQTTAQARASDLGYTDISQFGDKQLSNDEAYAACGPAAAVRFAERFGRNPTLREATDLAKQVGWTASGGMAGIQSEQQLLSNMGVDTHVVAPDWDAIAKEAQTGNPVTISTPGHYFFADGYNPESGAFHVGQSGLDLRQGSEWMTPAQMEALMGKAQGALFADNPNVPAKGAAGAPTALGGTTGAQNAPITLGGPAPARAPLYADTNQPATPIQSAADVVGQTVGGAASALGTAAQQALSTAQDINRIQPGTEALKAATPVLGGAAQSASTAVNQVAQDVQNAAQGALGAAQDVNRLTPGATAVNAAAPVLGAAASDLGAGARAAADTAGQTLGGLADQAHQQIVDAAQTPAGQALIQAGVQNATDPSLLPAGSRQLYQQISDAKNQWIDQNNPVRDVPVVGGLVSGIAQQLSDPLALATFGPTVGAGEAAGTAVAERLAPEASQFVQQVASKLTSGAIVGGIQNGLAAAEAPSATPQSVGEAVLTGAGLGAAVDVGGAAFRPVIVNVGRMVLDRAGALADAGLRAVERISPAQDVLATTRRVGESADDYLARLADEASGQRPPTGAGQLVGPRGEPLRSTPPAVAEPPVPEPTGFRAPETPGVGEPQPTAAVVRPPTRAGVGELPTTPAAVTAASADAAGVPLRAAVDPVAAHAEYAPNSATPLNGAVGHQATAVTAGAAPPAGTPLERINAMYDQQPGGPSIVQRVADGRTAVVRALTDRGVDIADAQQQYAKALGRPLNADELMYEMSRLQPGPAAEARVQQDLGPIIKSVGNDYQALRNYVTARSNVQVADAVGTDILRTQADANVPTALRDKVNATQTSLRMRQEALNNLQNASVPDDARVAAAQRSVNSAQRTLDRAQVAVETARQAVIDRAAQSGAEASANRMFSGGVSKADSQTAINQIQAELGPERFAKVQQAADQLSRYGQSLRDTLVSSGVLNEEQANGMLAKYPDWVKTRILKYMDEQTGGGAGQGQRIGLSSRDVHAYTVAGTSAAREDPIASMVAYTYQVERMAQKNNTFNALVKLDQGSPNPQLRQVSSDFSPTAAQSTVQGFVDGTKQRFVTDNKALGQAIEGASQTALPGFLTAWTNVFRALAASRNPAFVAGHASFTIPQYLIRQTAIEGGPQSLPRVIGALAQGYADVFHGFLRGKPLGEAGPGTQQLLRGGGGQFGALTGSQEDAAKAVRQMGGIDISKPEQAMNLVKNLITLKPVENLVNRVDYGPRVAAMRLAEARGAHPVQAIVAGRDATIDFNRGGTATKLLSQMIPFLNVGVQGPLQVARTFVDNPRAAIYTVGTLLGAPTLAAEIWNNADPQRAKDYADVPQYIKDQGIVIMLPTEAPVDAQGDRHPQFAWINTRNWTPFVSATRETADAVMGTSTHNWEQAAASMMSSALPVQAANPSDFAQKLALSAPGVQTIAQLSLNKDFYRGSDIVTKRADVGASPTAQFLTPGLQQVANAVAPGAEVRPSAVDFAIRNIGAGTAGAALSGTDAALRAAGYPPAQVSRPTAAGPAEIPVAGSVIGRFVRGQTGQELQTARGQVLTPDALQLLRSNGITTTPAADTSSVNQIPLKLDEEARYQQLTNQYVDAAIHRTAASTSFAGMTQVGKQSLMSAAITAARQKAGIEVLNTIPAAEKARRLKTKSTAPAAAA